MTHAAFHLLTHLGDSTLLTAISLAAIAILVWNGNRALALRFALAVAALLVTTFVLKVGFYSVGGNSDLNVLSPSGHAGFSVTVYGCFAAMLARQLRPGWAILVVAATAGLVATVLVSRVVLHFHTPQEVILGSAVGLLCVGGFLAGNHDLQRLRLHVPVPVIVALLICSVTVWSESRRFNFEPRIARLGLMLGSSLGTISDSDMLIIRQHEHHRH